MVWDRKVVCYGEHEHGAPSMMRVANMVSRSTTTVPPPLKRLISGMPAAFSAGMSTRRSGFLRSQPFRHSTPRKSHYVSLRTGPMMRSAERARRAVLSR